MTATPHVPIGSVPLQCLTLIHPHLPLEDCFSFGFCDGLFLIILSFFLSLFILRDRDHVQGRGRDRENTKQAPCCQHGARCRAQSYKPQDHDLSQYPESEVEPTKPPRCPYTFISDQLLPLRFSSQLLAAMFLFSDLLWICTLSLIRCS